MSESKSAGAPDVRVIEPKPQTEPGAKKPARSRNVNAIFNGDGREILEALRQGVRDALIRHRDRNNPVVIERDGKIMWFAAQDLLDELDREK